MRTNLRYLKGYYFLDYTHGEKQIFLDRLYETAAKIVIKYGGYGDYLCNIKERYIRDFGHTTQIIQLLQLFYVTYR